MILRKWHIAVALPRIPHEGCELPAGEVTGTVYGIALPGHEHRVQLVFKDPHRATLIVHLDPKDLRPGEYTGTVVVRTDVVSLVQPFKLTVQYHRPAGGLFVWLLACIIGFLVVTLRTASSSGGWRAVPREIRKITNIAAALCGFGAGYLILAKNYFNSGELFLARTQDFLSLGVEIFAAFVAAATVISGAPAVAAPVKTAVAKQKRRRAARRDA
jgi:hypothetical protein